MPILIDQLIIKTQISGGDAGGAGAGGADQAAIVQACVEQVLDILERQKAR